MAAKKMPAKKVAAKKAMSDSDARKKIAKDINSMVASGNAMKDYPTAKSLIDVLPDTIGEGSLRPKLGDKKFYAIANAEAKKIHARLKAAAGRGDMSRAVLQPSTRESMGYTPASAKKKPTAPAPKTSAKTMPVSMKKKKSK